MLLFIISFTAYSILKNYYHTKKDDISIVLISIAQ